MRGWVPHDEGALALTAERVLKGEIPHRDFQDLYTGGLTYCHALAFKALGVKLTSLRWTVFPFFLAWIPAVFSVARRFTSSLPAAGITILAAAWSLPNYSASMPSWYNLFFATFAAWSAFRFLESGNRLWLFWTGLSGGISTCVKISGIYCIASVLLFFIYCEQQNLPNKGDANPKRSIFTLAICVSMLAFVYLLFRMMGKLLSPLFFFDFVLPGIALAATVIWRELTFSHNDGAMRLRNLMRMLGPFTAGAAVPCLILLIPYIATGSLNSLIHGVLVAPQARLAFTSMNPIPLPEPRVTLLSHRCPSG